MKLLVVTDLEESSAAFFDSALQWAVRFADRVWIVHVEDPDPDFVGFETGPREVRDSIAQGIREHHRRLGAEADRWCESGLDTKSLVIQGPTVETILKEAAKIEADAIAMGAPTHGRLHALLLGNVADSLIRRSPCPVLVIPASGGGASDAG